MYILSVVVSIVTFSQF